MTSRRKNAYLMLLGAVVIWGAAAPIIKHTLTGIDPLPFLAYRFALASLVSSIFFVNKIRHKKKFHQLRKNFPLAVVYGFLAVPVGLGMLFLALDKTTVLDLTLIGVLTPMLITLGGSYFFHDHITKREKLGISVVLLGVIFNSFVPIFLSNSVVILTGNLLLLLYLLADASSVLIAKRTARKKIKSANLTNLAFIIGGLTIVPLAIAKYGLTGFSEIIATLPFEYHLGVWYMAFISGNLAYYLSIRAQRSIEVSEATLFTYLQPLVMIPLAVFWLHEELSLHFFIGAILIAIGIWIAESKKSKVKALSK